MADLTAAMDALKEERRKVQEKIDQAMQDPAGKSGFQAAKAKFNDLLSQKNALINQKKALREQMDKVKNQTDKLIKDKKDTRSSIKFGSLEEIEKEIKKLQRKQETTTMSLTEEKKLIKEVEALQSSKRFVSQLADKDGALDGAKEQRKSIKDQITAKDKEIDAVSKELDAAKAAKDAFYETNNKKRDSVQEFFKKRDELKKQMGEKIKEKDSLRDTFREKNNAWYNYQRAVRAQKKIQYEEEKKKRDEEKAAYLAKIEAEEAKKIPYEAEQALCEFLADFLERTYLNKTSETKEAKKDIVEVKDDPFAGFKPKKKDDDIEYFGKGKGKKKRNRQSKKQDASGPFTLSVDMFEQFGFLSLTPPTSVDQVEKSVKELRDKKEWYKQQPRGSVPTAQEIRKANEKNAAKVRQSADKTQAEPKTNKKGGFSLSNEEFTPLGAGGAASSVNSSWGQKPAAV